MVIEVYFFKQKTAYEMRISDWSSDVCSSDLCSRSRFPAPRRRPEDQPDSWLSVLEGSWALTPVLAMQRKGEDFGTAPAPGASAADGVLRCGIGPQTREENCLAAAYAWQIGRASCRERVCQYV